jgi:hypothetical protein
MGALPIWTIVIFFLFMFLILFLVVVRGYPKIKVDRPSWVSKGPPGYCQMPSGSACWCNIFVIVVGILIAMIGLANGLFADPDNSALRQTVAALWVIQGLIGLLIAAVGVLGFTYFANLPSD